MIVYGHRRGWFYVQYCKHRNLRAVHIFAHFAEGFRCAKKTHVSENCYHNRTNGVNWYVRENLAARICILMLDVRKFSCAKICTFTVHDDDVKIHIF